MSACLGQAGAYDTRVLYVMFLWRASVSYIDGLVRQQCCVFVVLLTWSSCFLTFIDIYNTVRIIADFAASVIILIFHTVARF